MWASGDRVILHSAEETIQLGVELASNLPSPWVIALTGDLGAGKTTFVSGLAQGLQCLDRADSPTFTIIQEYRGKRPLLHCDWYRIERSSELVAIGWDEMLDQHDRIVIEWAEKHPRMLPSNTRWLTFTIEGEQRIVTVGSGW